MEVMDMLGRILECTEQSTGKDQPESDGNQ